MQYHGVDHGVECDKKKFGPITHMAAIVKNTSPQVGVMWPKFMKLCSE